MTRHTGSRGALLLAAALLLGGMITAGAALVVTSAAAARSPADAVAAAPWTPEERPVATAAGAATSVARTGTASSLPDDAAPGAVAAPPRRLRIAALAVDAPVGDLGLTADGRLEVPATPDRVGWWSGGSAPAASGPTVLAAHVDWMGHPGVFQRLADLRPGELVEITDAAGAIHRFSVQRVEQHAKDEFPTAAVYGSTDEPSLRLITCGGAFVAETGSYRDNVIVFAEAVAAA